MSINIFVGVTVALAIIAITLGAYILYRHYSQRHQRLIKVANDEAKHIILRAAADAAVEVDRIRVHQELEEKRQLKKWEANNNELMARSEALRFQQDELLEREEQILKREQSVKFEWEKYLQKFDELLESQANLVGQSVQETHEELVKGVEQKYAREMTRIIKNIETKTNIKAKEVATNIIVSAMERYKTDVVAEKTVSYVHLDSDEMKGRIIGKDGRNIKAFEQYGGVDIFIDDTPNVVTISSFNPMRREIAKLALETLIIDGRIQPIRIEEELSHQSALIEATIFEQGKHVLEELGITEMDEELIRLLGKLKYRTSYGQPVLNHVIETAKICGMLAAELDLDVALAIRAGLLHDIGKASDFEVDGNHVSIGVELAMRAGESPIVVNSIAAHHGDTKKESVYAELVVIADAISAGRLGARNNSTESFFVRMSDIEKAILKNSGISSAFVLQSGRQIRVIVDPLVMKDEDIQALPKELEKVVRETALVPGDVTITVIRELRSTYIARQTAVN